jgi:hypothetical protein
MVMYSELKRISKEEDVSYVLHSREETERQGKTTLEHGYTHKQVRKVMF